MRKQIPPAMLLLFGLVAGLAAAQQQTKAPLSHKNTANDHDKDDVGKVVRPSPAASAKQPAKPYLERTDPREMPKTQAAPASTGYVIGPQDVLAIDVWNEKDFSRGVTVRPDGKITLPLLNDIQAAGLTPTQVAASIAELLKRYVTDPQVTVTVAQITSMLVFVTGEVNRAGGIPVLPNMTVLQAISMAGGLNQFANPKKLYVLRTEKGKQVKYPFNYRDVIRGKASDQNIFIKPGDTIVVP